MSLSLRLINASRALTQRAGATTGRLTTSNPFVPLAITSPPMGSLKSTGIARSFGIGDVGSILSGAGSILGGIQSGGLLGGINAGVKLLGGGGSGGGGMGLPSLPGGFTSGGTLPGGAPSGGGIGTTGTAGGGCINTPFGSVCLGGSAGLGSSFTGPGNNQLPAVTGSSGCAPRGYHLNKTGYYTHQGYVAPGTKLVRNRRRNPLNPRALSRSLSRLDGFDRATKAVEKQLARVGRRHAPRRSSPKSCGCKKR